MNLRGDTLCFACGPDNPIGLKLTFTPVDGGLRTEFVPGAEHQSYQGFMHGGLISTILDEVMGKILFERGIDAMTARLEVRFRRPVPVGTRLVCTGQVTALRGKLIETRAVATTADGTPVAEAKASFMRV